MQIPSWLPVGFEHRIEKLYTVCLTPFSNRVLLLVRVVRHRVLIGQYNVLEFFAEANIPLLSDVPGAQALNLDLAYRYSDYSTSGGNSTYRVGLNWQPIEMVRVRVGYNRAVRAPNVG